MRSFLFIPYICCNFSPSGDPKNLKRMEEQKEKLFAEFPPVGTQEWLDKIQVDLKGADFEKRLVWKTTEGFKVQPFYRREDTAQLPTTNALPGEYPYLRGTKTRGNGWSVRQAIRVADVAEALALLPAKVQRGGLVLANASTLAGILMEKTTYAFDPSTTLQSLGLELVQNPHVSDNTVYVVGALEQTLFLNFWQNINVRRSEDAMLVKNAIAFLASCVCGFAWNSNNVAKVTLSA